MNLPTYKECLAKAEESPQLLNQVESFILDNELNIPIGYRMNWRRSLSDLIQYVMEPKDES